MSAHEPIRVQVDVTNPGQFFGCGGLLEEAARLWHPRQRTEAGQDGSPIVRFDVSHLREAERLVPTRAPECEALNPPELRARVAAALIRAAGDACPAIPTGG